MVCGSLCIHLYLFLCWKNDLHFMLLFINGIFLLVLFPIHNFFLNKENHKRMFGFDKTDAKLWRIHQNQLQSRANMNDLWPWKSCCFYFVSKFVWLTMIASGDDGTGSAMRSIIFCNVFFFFFDRFRLTIARCATGFRWYNANTVAQWIELS